MCVLVVLFVVVVIFLFVVFFHYFLFVCLFVCFLSTLSFNCACCAIVCRSLSPYFRYLIHHYSVSGALLYFRIRISYLSLQRSLQHQNPSHPSNKMKTTKGNEAGRRPPSKDMVCQYGRSIRKRYDTKA